MEIRKFDNTSFGSMTKSRELFETLLMKNFKSECAIDGIKTVTKDLYPDMRFVGHRGYKYYALQIQEAVKKNHPELANDTLIIKKHIEQNPQITKPELAEFVEPFIKKYGENIDINI